MSLSVCNEPYSSQVPAASYHNEVTDIELNELCDLAGTGVNANSVVDTYGGIGITNSATVVGHTIRDAFFAQLNTSHFSQLVLYRRGKKRFVVKTYLTICFTGEKCFECAQNNKVEIIAPLSSVIKP